MAGGEQYEGQWRDNVIHGSGCFEAPGRQSRPGDSSRSIFSLYKGQYVHGDHQGFGEYSYTAQGSVCLGSWDSNGSGWARICYDNGMMYEGECQDGIRHGQGELRFVLPLGSEHDDPLDLDQLKDDGVEQVLRIFGGRVVGGFERDLCHGSAVLMLANGQVEHLVFTHGDLDG